MNLMLELPGGKYFAVPRDVLKKYSVSKEGFEKELAEKERTGTSVFSAEVEGQDDRRKSVPFGVRG